MTYTTEEKICILLSEAKLSNAKFFELWKVFGNAKSFVQGVEHSEDAKKILGKLHGEVCAQIKRNEADKIVNRMQSEGVFATTCFSDTYPQSLAEIPDPPYVLYYKGNVELLNSRCLAVVGTRKASSYGRRVTTDFTKVLSENFTIVSGLAYGVDSIAHETALKHNGKTIAVLGGGLVKVYPSSNQNLADQIVQSGGLLLSEYGMYAQPLPYNFPHRNRIVSGLSLGVLVCQAPQKSGTVSTVECALDQGRDVFVVPGEVYDAGFAGSNSMIKSLQGACVTTPRDIEEFYHLDAAKTEGKIAVQLNFEEQRVVEALSLGQLTFDELVEKTEISAADLNFLLANLEIKSIIARLPGNSYRLYGGSL